MVADRTAPVLTPSVSARPVGVRGVVGEWVTTLGVGGVLDSPMTTPADLIRC